MRILVSIFFNAPRQGDGELCPSHYCLVVVVRPRKSTSSLQAPRIPEEIAVSPRCFLVAVKKIARSPLNGVRHA